MNSYGDPDYTPSLKEIDEDDAIQSLSSIFSFLNESPFGNGTLMPEH